MALPTVPKKTPKPGTPVFLISLQSEGGCMHFALHAGTFMNVTDEGRTYMVKYNLPAEPGEKPDTITVDRKPEEVYASKYQALAECAAKNLKAGRGYMDAAFACLDQLRANASS